jgi:hypothetical protein
METRSRDDLDGPEFQDAYTDAMAKIIEAKRENRELPETPEPDKPGKVLDLMAALTESLQRTPSDPAARTPKPKCTTCAPCGRLFSPLSGTAPRYVPTATSPTVSAAPSPVPAGGR